VRLTSSIFCFKICSAEFNSSVVLMLTLMLLAVKVDILLAVLLAFSVAASKEFASSSKFSYAAPSEEGANTN